MDAGHAMDDVHVSWESLKMADTYLCVWQKLSERNQLSGAENRITWIDGYLAD